MSPQLSFNALALRELQGATDFYSAESPALADAFLSEVAGALSQIREFPGSCPLISRTVRRKILSRFPYSVLYYLQSDEIRVVAIAHQKRRPFYWRGRG